MASLADVDKLIEEWTPQLRKAFTDAVYAMRDQVVVDDVVAALRRGDLEAAVRAVNLDPINFRGLDVVFSQAFEAGGVATAGSMRALRSQDTGARLLVLFNARNPEAEAWLRTHSSELIREIVDDQRELVRAHLVAGMEKGEGPRKVALDLVGRLNPTTRKREGGAIGLTGSQEQWAKNYEAELLANKPGALDRKLRDKRYDRTVAKAIRDGKPLSPDQVSSMVNAYRQRALKARAEGIARTEAMAALNQSQEAAVEQGIAKGAVQEKYVTKKWKSSKDNRVRHTHVVMDGQVVPYRGLFRSPSGATLRYPGDPDAPAEERVQCRCTWEIKVDYIAMARDGK